MTNSGTVVMRGFDEEAAKMSHNDQAEE